MAARRTEFSFDAEKFAAAVHYVCRSCETFELGKTKLHKTLWRADFEAYRASGQPITGETYRKDKYGPVAAHLDPALQSLTSEVNVSQTDEGDWDFETDTDPDMSSFSVQEMEILDAAIRYVCVGRTANSISEESHDRIWEIAALREPIPYSSSLVSELGEITEDDIEWARQSLRDVE